MTYFEERRKRIRIPIQNENKTDPCRVPLGPSRRYGHIDQSLNTLKENEEDECVKNCEKLGIDRKTCEIECWCRPLKKYI